MTNSSLKCNVYLPFMFVSGIKMKVTLFVISINPLVDLTLFMSFFRFVYPFFSVSLSVSPPLSLYLSIYQSLSIYLSLTFFFLQSTR